MGVTGQPLAQHPHYGGLCAGDMEGRGHGRSFRQDAEAEGSRGWSSKLPPCSRLQGRCAIPGNELKLPKSFAAFCEENKEVRDMVENGKGNLQWERDIPPAALSNLENLAKTDFKSNLGKIIHDIYQT